MNRQIYKMTISDTADSITFYLLDVPIVKKNVEGTATNTTIDGNVFTDYMWLKDQWEQKWSIMCNPEWSKLDAIYKRQFSDADVPTLKVFYGDNIYTDGSAEGSSFQIMNDSEVYEGEIRGFSLYGDTTQKTVSGKNKLNYSLETIKASNTGSAYTWTGNQVEHHGVTYTINDDLTITANGTSVGSSYIVLNSSLALESNTSYIMTGCPSGGGASTYTLRIYAGSSYTSENGNGITFTYTNQNYVRVNVPGGSQVSNVVFKPMIRLATETDATYIPFVGGVDSPNPNYPQEVKTVSGLQTVEITGKNLCSNAFVVNTTNVQFNCDIASITGDTITLSAIIDEATSNNSVYAHVDGINTSIRIGTFTGQAGAVGKAICDVSLISSYLETGKELQLFLYKGGANFTSVSNAMIVNGSTPEPYEPYQGQSYEVFLGSPSVWDFTALSETLTYVSVSEKTTSSITIEDTGASGNQSVRYQITGLDASAKYSLSGVAKKLAQSTGGYHRMGVAWTGSNDGSTWSAQVNLFLGVYSVGEEQQFCGILTGFSQYRVWFINNSSTTTTGEKTRYYDVKLRENTIELCKIDTHQDYIYKSGEKWYKHAEVGKVVLDGTEDWRKLNNAFQVQTDATPGKANSNTPALSSHFTYHYYASSITTNIQNGEFGWNNSTPPLITMRNDDCVDADAFKTWLSTYNTTVYYVIETSTDTEITDAELVEQLNALLAGSLYKGLNNVFLIPNAGADGTMTLDYRIHYEKETVVQDTMPVKLDLTDGGIINACLCRQNVQVIMRETVR